MEKLKKLDWFITEYPDMDDRNEAIIIYFNSLHGTKLHNVALNSELMLFSMDYMKKLKAKFGDNFETMTPTNYKL